MLHFNRGMIEGLDREWQALERNAVHADLPSIARARERARMLLDWIAEIEVSLEAAQRQRPIGAAIAAVDAIDLEALNEAARVEAADAVAWRERLTERARVASGGDLTRRLASMFSRWTDVETVPAPPPPRPTAVERHRQAIAGSVRLAGDILLAVDKRLTMLRLASDLAGPPGRPTPPAQIQRRVAALPPHPALAPAELGWIEPLALLLIDDERAQRNTHMALAQWDEARARYDEARVLLTALSHASADAAARLLTEYGDGPLRGAMAPLTRLHLTFGGIRYLEDFFPAPRPVPIRPGGGGARPVLAPVA
jgi:hypothetical protein